MGSPLRRVVFQWPSLVLSAFALIGATLVATIFLAPTAANASVTGWNAGKIIDDAVFTNSETMTAQQIQSFLNDRVPICDTYGLQPSEFGGGTRAQWAAARGYSPPFTCLKDFSEGGKTAAQIIYDASQEFAINPQVLIVLLQKEQSLITDTWPIPGSSQYRTATGYGCPDTAPCDSQYYGLTNQLRWSARMFRAIMNASPTWYTPYIVGNNFIQYSPNASCGGTNVNIQNRSTQALYNYTPYQPNPAALAAGWGTVPCGAYGNRNFFLYFNQWFGSTYTPAYGWSNGGALIYTSSDKRTLVDLSQVKSGTRLYVSLRTYNAGTITWRNDGPNPMRLGTWGPQDRSSSFCDSTWLSCNRSAVLKESSVPPGGVGTFEFWMNVPETMTPGWKLEDFNLVAEGATWLADGFRVSLTVDSTYAGRTLEANTYFDDSRANLISLGSAHPEQSVFTVVKMYNAGNVAWSNSTSPVVRLGTWGPQDRSSSFCDSTWLSCNRSAVLKESSVPPGGVGTFEFWMKTGTRTGGYAESFKPVAEGAQWFTSEPVTFYSLVSSRRATWAMVSRTAYSDINRTTAIATDGNLTLSAGQSVYLEIRLINTGNTVWQKDGLNQTRVGTWNSLDRQSIFCSASWVNCNRAGTLVENVIPPGGTGTFRVTITAPPYRGTHYEFYNLVTEGQSWHQASGLLYTINVI